MRLITSLPHESIFVGRVWNPITQKGNYDNSRSPIDTIVLHTMVGTLAGTTEHFKTWGVNSSAHYGIDFLGRIVNWLPENATAYHAGKYSVNQRSIGIEHEDLGKPNDPRPDALYERSSQLVADIAKFYNIPLDREHVKIHREIAATACPGTLDVDRILRQARAIIKPITTKMVEVADDVFMRLVTKSSEYDEVWRAMRLDETLKEHPGSHKLLLAAVDERISQAVAASTPVIPVTPPDPSPDSLTEQDKNILFQTLPEVWGRLKGIFIKK